MKYGNTKPYVNAAFMCEKVLTEKNEVTSYIRVIDHVTIEGPDGVPPNERPTIRLVFVVTLKAGDLVGDFEVQFVFHSPGRTHDTVTLPLKLAGGLHGHSFHLDANLLAGEFGDGRLQVLWYGEELTCVPFSLRRKGSASDGSDGPTTATAH